MRYAHVEVTGNVVGSDIPIESPFEIAAMTPKHQRGSGRNQPHRLLLSRPAPRADSRAAGTLTKEGR